MHEIETPSALFEFLNTNPRAVIKFSSEYCGPCRAIEPRVQQLEKDNTQVAFAGVDLAKAYRIAEEFGVQSAPTFVYFYKGNETSRVVGANIPEISKHLAELTEFEGKSAQEGASTSGSSAEFPNSLQQQIVKQQLEILNVGTTGAHLFTTGETTTVTDADSQLLAFVPFQSRVTAQSIMIKVADIEQRPAHIKIFASLVSALSFEDAASHKALVDQDLGEPNADGWIEVNLRLVHFQNVSSLLLFITGEDDDEPTAIQRIVVRGNVKEQPRGSIHEEEE